MVTPLLAWTFELTRPLWLALLLLIAVFFWFTRRAARGRIRPSDWTALVFRSVLLAAIALALAAPRVQFDAATRSVAGDLPARSGRVQSSP